MKLYLWKNNNSQSDADVEYGDNISGSVNNFYSHDSSNAHSGGCVVLAENDEEAFQLLKKYNDNFDMRNEEDRWSEYNGPKPIEIPLDKKMVVLFCSGDCG